MINKRDNSLGIYEALLKGSISVGSSCAMIPGGVLLIMEKNEEKNTNGICFLCVFKSFDII